MDSLKRYILWFVAVGTVALPFFYFSSSLSSRQDLNFFEKIVLSVSNPFDAVFRFVKIELGGAVDEYLLLLDAKREAAGLRQENARLAIRLQVASELEQENVRLRELLSFADRSGQDFLASRVLSRDPSYFFDSIRIDRGMADGVRPGMAVVAASGAVGLVMKVGASTAHVLLLTDPNMSLDVIVARNRKRGVLKGLAASRLILRHTGSGSRVQVGDQIITSGLTGSFPRGVAVGRVAAIQLDSDNITQIIEVQPEVDFAEISEVLVLRKPNPELEIINEVGGADWLDRVLQTSGEKGGG